MLEGFTHAAKRIRTIPPDSLVVSSKGGTLRMSQDVYDRLDCPKRVEIFYNSKTRQFMFRKAVADSRTAYVVKDRQIAAKHLRKRLGFPVGLYRCIFQNGAMIATYQGEY